MLAPRIGHQELVRGTHGDRPWHSTSVSLSFSMTPPVLAPGTSSQWRLQGSLTWNEGASPSSPQHHLYTQSAQARVKGWRVGWDLTPHLVCSLQVVRQRSLRKWTEVMSLSLTLTHLLLSEPLQAENTVGIRIYTKKVCNYHQQETSLRWNVS